AFSQYMGIPPALGFLNILAESIGGLILLAGLFTRISAFGLAVTMIVAGSTHISNGFFMNWSGTAAGEGFEYHILYLAIAMVLFIKGGGAYAADSVLLKKVESSAEKNYKLQRS
ncbi:MAG: DoxX family protein, partial [Ignavibacteriaceae bacterium]